MPDRATIRDDACRVARTPDYNVHDAVVVTVPIAPERTVRLGDKHSVPKSEHTWYIFGDTPYVWQD
jgi:hypothetical protein